MTSVNTPLRKTNRKSITKKCFTLHQKSPAEDAIPAAIKEIQPTNVDNGGYFHCH